MWKSILQEKLQVDDCKHAKTRGINADFTRKTLNYAGKYGKTINIDYRQLTH